MKDFYKVLADKNRRKIINILSNKELSVNELLAFFSIKQATLSSHLSILLEAGLVNVRKKSRMRFYSINKSILDNFLNGLNKYFNNEQINRVDVGFDNIEIVSRR